MVYGDFKDLAKRTTSNKILRNKTFSIPKNPKYDGYQRGLASIIQEFFDKKTTAASKNKFAGSVLNKINNQLKNETNHLLKALKKEKYIHHSKVIFAVLILQICN